MPSLNSYAAPGRSAASWRSCSAASEASVIRPDSTSAPIWTSAIGNRMYAASKERLATVYPASAAAIASVMRPASPEATTIAHAVAAPARAGSA